MTSCGAEDCWSVSVDGLQWPLAKRAMKILSKARRESLPLFSGEWGIGHLNLALSRTHKFVHYTLGEKKKLAVVLKLGEAGIPGYSIFGGHGHLQHTGAGWS